MRPGRWGVDTFVHRWEGKRNLIFLGKNAIQYVASLPPCFVLIPSPPPFIRYYIKRLLSFQGKNIAGIVAATRKFRYPPFEISARSDAIPLVCPNFFSFSFWQRKGGNREEEFWKRSSRGLNCEKREESLSRTVLSVPRFFSFFLRTLYGYIFSPARGTRSPIELIHFFESAIL